MYYATEHLTGGIRVLFEYNVKNDLKIYFCSKPLACR